MLIMSWGKKRNESPYAITVKQTITRNIFNSAFEANENEIYDP